MCASRASACSEPTAGARLRHHTEYFENHYIMLARPSGMSPGSKQQPERFMIIFGPPVNHGCGTIIRQAFSACAPPLPPSLAAWVSGTEEHQTTPDKPSLGRVPSLGAARTSGIEPTHTTQPLFSCTKARIYRDAPPQTSTQCNILETKVEQHDQLLQCSDCSIMLETVLCISAQPTPPDNTQRL